MATLQLNKPAINLETENLLTESFFEDFYLFPPAFFEEGTTKVGLDADVDLFLNLKKVNINGLWKF